MVKVFQLKIYKISLMVKLLSKHSLKMLTYYIFPNSVVLYMARIKCTTSNFN